MIDRTALLIISLTAVVWPLSALAKSESGDAEVRRIAFDYANCVVRKNHSRAAALILSNADNTAIKHDYLSLLDRDCMKSGVGLKFGMDQFRYGLADALVRADLSAREDKDFSDRLPLAHLAMPTRDELAVRLAATSSKKKRAEMQDDFNKEFSISWLSRFGECVARRNPVASKYWILTVPDSPEEISRINALRPDFSECLDKGTLAFSRSVLRGAVALNYYRLAFATKQAGAESIH